MTGVLVWRWLHYITGYCLIYQSWAAPVFRCRSVWLTVKLTALHHRVIRLPSWLYKTATLLLGDSYEDNDEAAAHQQEMLLEADVFFAEFFCQRKSEMMEKRVEFTNPSITDRLFEAAWIKMAASANQPWQTQKRLQLCQSDRFRATLWWCSSRESSQTYTLSADSLFKVFITMLVCTWRVMCIPARDVVY